jgi:thymidylate synthase ThyX
LYPHTNLSLGEIKECVDRLSTEEKREIVKTYVGQRKSRFHRPGRAFEETYYTFDILADIGAYRDLQRHRVLTQEHQKYTVAHGYINPPEMGEAGLIKAYQEALNLAAATYEIISQQLPDAAQYIVPFAYKIRWRVKFNLREAYHFIELRSARQGHPSYRAIAQSMYYQIKSVHPFLTSFMDFVDLNNYELERLAAEQKIDARLKLKDNK